MITSEGCGFTEAMFEWCIAELRWKASIYRDSGLVSVYQADVSKSDIAIPQSLNQALCAAVKDLELVSIAIIISNSTIYLCEPFHLIIQIWQEGRAKLVVSPFPFLFM